MMSKHLFLTSLAASAVVLPLLSWALSALGVSCRSILDEDGLRWLFRHTGDCLHSRLDACVLCFSMMQGAMRSLLPLGRTFRQPRFYRLAAVYAVILLAILVPAVLPDSPLLSLTGGLWGSPLLSGLPFLGWFSFMVFCLCYGRQQGSIFAMLSFGFRRFPLLLPTAVLISFCYQCVMYMFS